MSIAVIVIGLALLAGGLLLAILLRGKLSGKAVDVQYMRTTKLSELKQTFAEMESSGLGGNLRQYVELQGAAACAAPPKTPYAGQEAAYYEASLVQVYEATETYRDSEGHERRRTVRREDTISNEKSTAPLLLRDAETGETVTLDLRQGGMQLDLMEGCDRFEPAENMANYAFFGSVTTRRLGNRTLGYRLKERVIPLGQPLYVLGEAYLRGPDIFVGNPEDKKKSFIVSTKSEQQIAGEAKRGAAFALAGGIVLAAAGLAVAVYGFFAK